MQDEGSDAGSVAAALPQEQITMLLNNVDFQEKVCQDPANLCCVIVTSTLCPQCGIRRISYPKVPRPAHDDDDENANDDADEGEAEEEDDDAEIDPHNSNHNSRSGGGGHFYRDVEQRLVKRRETAVQRRHVRFFHVCACAESETCIDFLVAADPAYRVLNKKPTAREVAQLRKTAHRQLHELLTTLEVRSTPCMRFYLAGQPLRYTSMASSNGGSSDAHSSGGGGAAVPRGVSAANDVITASGANVVKWARVLENAVVVRNEVMREYDAEQREKARLARAEAKRLAREARKREDAGEGEEEEEEDGE